MGQIFERDENQRYTAHLALQHPFIKADRDRILNRSSTVVDDTPFMPEMGETGANAGVVERRLELVKRLQNAHTTFTVVPSQSNADKQRFSVQDERTKRSTIYEWQSTDLVREVSSNHLSLQELKKPNEQFLQATNLAKVFEDHNIPVDSFGRGEGKSFNAYLQELREGRSMLLIDATQYKSLVRVVPVTLLHIELVMENQSFVLVEILPSGSFQHAGIRPQPHETSAQACLRLKQALWPLRDLELEMDFNSIARVEVEAKSPSYPNLRTIYKKCCVPAKIPETSPEILARLGVGTKVGPAFTVEGLEEYPVSYKWLSGEEALALGLTLGQPSEFSALVYPPMGFQEEELNQFLVDSGVPLQHWGTQNFKSLSEFSEELLKGEAALAKQPDGKVLREVEIVVLNLMKENGDVLLEVEEEYQGESVERRRLPALKKLVCEHHFWAARRMIAQFLKLPNDRVIVNPDAVRTTETIEESTSYYGLSTIYRKTFIEGRIQPEQPEEEAK